MFVSSVYNDILQGRSMKRTIDLILELYTLAACYLPQVTQIYNTVIVFPQKVPTFYYKETNSFVEQTLVVVDGLRSNTSTPVDYNMTCKYSKKRFFQH